MYPIVGSGVGVSGVIGRATPWMTPLTGATRRLDQSQATAVRYTRRPGTYGARRCVAAASASSFNAWCRFSRERRSGLKSFTVISPQRTSITDAGLEVRRLIAAAFATADGLLLGLVQDFVQLPRLGARRAHKGTDKRSQGVGVGGRGKRFRRRQNLRACEGCRRAPRRVTWPSRSSRCRPTLV